MIPPLHRYANSEAGRLLRELRAVQPKKGKYARRAELLVKGEALDLLTTIGAPRNVAKLFDAALGDVRDRLNELHPTRPWVEAATWRETVTSPPPGRRSVRAYAGRTSPAVSVGTSSA